MELMKKIAIFVEGQTELIFTRKLVEEIAGKRAIYFSQEDWISNKFVPLAGAKIPTTDEYFVLLVDCHSDGAVKSALLERRRTLVSQGYDRLIGLRDVYPIARGDIAQLQRGLAYGLPTQNPPTKILLAVMEVEAWFVQEEYHWSAIDPSLTKSNLRNNHAFDPDADSAEHIANPAKFLDDVYKTAGKRYRKTKNQVTRTVNALNYVNLYIHCRSLLPQLDAFIDELDQFFS